MLQGPMNVKYTEMLFWSRKCFIFYNLCKNLCINHAKWKRSAKL